MKKFKIVQLNKFTIKYINFLLKIRIDIYNSCLVFNKRFKEFGHKF